jgi:general secretion pathway protein K
MTSEQSKKRRGKLFSQQGVALIAVTVATSIVMVLVTEFSTNTNVDMTAARNNEAEVKTHFLARSGMNLSKLVIVLQGVLDGYRETIGDIQLADYVGLFMGAFGGSKEEVEGMAAMLGGFAAKDMRGLGVPEGSFGVDITTEDSKINLNCAKRRDVQEQRRVKEMLGALFYFDAYNPIFENEDAEGWRRDRDTQAMAFIDYVDEDNSKWVPPGESSGASEDYGYENLGDRYEAKNNFLDTVGEIKLIRGVDDRFFSLFGSAFTVYGGCTLNLSAVDNPQQIAAVITLAAKDKNDPASAGANAWNLGYLVIKMREFGQTFSKAEDFAGFVKDPKKFVDDLLGGLSATIDPSQLGIDPALLQMLQTVQGVELDLNPQSGLPTIVSFGPRRTYRVEATATFGKLSKRIIGVWDTKPTNQNTRTPGNNESRPGTWVFWRED